jgi:hypothetical protein
MELCLGPPPPPQNPSSPTRGASLRSDNFVRTQFNTSLSLGRKLILYHTKPGVNLKFRVLSDRLATGNGLDGQG